MTRRKFEVIGDTTNFTDLTAYRGGSDEKLHLVERFKRLNAEDLQDTRSRSTSRACTPGRGRSR